MQSAGMQASALRAALETACPRLVARHVRQPELVERVAAKAALVQRVNRAGVACGHASVSGSAARLSGVYALQPKGSQLDRPPRNEATVSFGMVSVMQSVSMLSTASTGIATGCGRKP